MAPTIAVSKLLDRTGLKLQDFDFYEIHEAFAAQVLCTLRAWESEDYCRNRRCMTPTKSATNSVIRGCRDRC